MEIGIEQVRIGKDKFVKERNENYNGWQWAFWREFFQNSIDAGAKNLNILLNAAEGKSALGRDPSHAEVIRVVFDDDAKGMDEDTLRNVFFRLGETTKKGEDGVGGFGRAREMTCFSHVRFSIRTQDLYVEGDGPEFKIWKISDAIELKRKMVEAARAEHSSAMIAAAEQPLPRPSWDDGMTDQDYSAKMLEWENAEEARRKRVEEARQQVTVKERKVTGLETELSKLETEPSFYQGCRFEVDIDPNEQVGYYKNRPSLDSLKEHLEEYLTQSKVPAKVLVNGEENVKIDHKGRLARTLVAVHEDGTEIEFAKIYTTNNPEAKYRGKVIVRVGGLTMFVESTNAATPQAYIEIEAKMAKKHGILAASRDDLRSPFRESLQEFVTALQTEANEALKSKEKREYHEIKGGRGRLNLPAVAPEEVNISAGGGAFAQEVSAQSEPLDVEERRRRSVRAVTEEEFHSSGYDGVPKDMLVRLLADYCNGKDTFLDRYHDLQALERFTDDLLFFNPSSGHLALNRADDELRSFILATLQARIDEAQKKKVNLLAGMHDVHIMIEEVKPEVRKAARAYNPERWDAESGRGKAPAKLLAAWTAACQEAMRLLGEIAPAHKSKVFTTGFLFEDSAEEWADGKWGRRRTHARAAERKDSQDNKFYAMLLNPVDDEGKNLYITNRGGAAPKYDIRTEEGRQMLISVAIHEIGHMRSMEHSSLFANTITQMFGAFRYRETHKAMKDAMSAVDAAFGAGKTRIQKMDDEPGTRPSERLLAHAAPATSFLIGSTADDDSQLTSMKLAASSAIGAFDDEGVREVDCDALAEIEEAAMEAVLEPERAMERTMDYETDSIGQMKMGF